MCQNVLVNMFGRAEDHIDNNKRVSLQCKSEKGGGGGLTHLELQEIFCFHSFPLGGQQ